MTDSVAVVISSCDRYSDLWKPFFTLLFRYWPDCPWPLYLQSNHQTFDDTRVTTIAVGDDSDWSTGFARFLDQVPHRYVVVLMEDYLLTKPVRTAELSALARTAGSLDAACLRLFPCPGPDRPLSDHPGLGEIAVGAAYRLSLQAALWDKAALAALLVPGESAWELELKGSGRADRVARPFLSVERSPTADYALPYFCTGVEKGRWLRPALRLCRREGIAIDLARRPAEPLLFDWVRRAGHGHWLPRLRRLESFLVGRG